MNSLETNTNCTTRFLLPNVFPNTTYDELIANGFKKAYIGMLDDERYDDSLIMLFHNDTDDEVLGELFGDMDVNVIEDEDNEDQQLIVVNDWQDYIGDNDYPNFLSGNYQLFEDQLKENILSFWREDKDSMLGMGLYDNPKLADMLDDFSSPLFVKTLNVDTPKVKVWQPPDVIENELYFTGEL